MGAKGHQSHLQKKVPCGYSGLCTATSFVQHRDGCCKCSREKYYPALSPFLTLSPGDCAADACSHPDFPSALTSRRLAQSSNILVGSFLAPSFCPSRDDRSSIYPATTMDLLLVHDLKCPEQLAGQSCGLWPLAKGSLMVKPDPKVQSRKWQPNQAPQCWPTSMTFLLSQDPAQPYFMHLREKIMKLVKGESGKEWQILNEISDKKAHFLILLTSRK